MTEKLFYADPYLRSFTAQVQSCTEENGRFAVVLDCTAFFPEGGGQSWDTGVLGSAAVTEVQQRDGCIVHYCDRPVSGAVTGQIDWARRFDLMQQHSGEHLVSGCVFRRFGLHNVGFHLGAEVMTVDFDGLLTPQQLEQIELAANEAVWADLETEILLPTEEELCKLEYRSKREIEGQVRLVRFPGVDTCACCGTHVRRTGEIGLIKLLSAVKFRQGVRVELVCGRRAYAHVSAVAAQNRRISNLLSAKPLQTAQAAERMADELSRTKFALSRTRQRCDELLAQRHAGQALALVFEPELSADGLRRLTAALMETTGGLCAAFSGTDEAGYQYALGQTGGDLRQLVKTMHQTLGGRGGGKPFFAQGFVSACRGQIEAFFAPYEKRL
ncbi:MAG: alanyl-tRNA editing protein [Firmicutes bacterium]|nr:alanyl-tRNA editing protein [Bacillota bacterium]MDY2720197.1 alanyl-tRNA editing protein [Candidatus Faecousia sp.]